jgi:hypothetical protein
MVYFNIVHHEKKKMYIFRIITKEVHDPKLVSNQNVISQASAETVTQNGCPLIS